MAGDKQTTLSIGQRTPQWDFSNALGSVHIVGHCFGSAPDKEAAAALQGECAALNALPGNYTTVVERQNEMAISIDQSGVYPFYYRTAGDSLQVSDTSTDLGTEPNASYLAATIVSCPILATGQSAIRNVVKLEGGQVARFPKHGEPAIADRHIVPDPHYSFEEAAVALGKTLTRAVGSRLELGLSTSDCSGGRDSGTISLLAARQSSRHYNALIQYTQGTIAGDLPHALAITRDYPNITLHQIIGGDEVLPFQNMQSIGLTNEPDLGAAINARLRQRLMAARELGSELHMTGDGGDLVLNAPFLALVGLSRNSQSALLRELVIERASTNYKAPKELLEYIDDYSSKPFTAECQELAAYLQSPIIFHDQPFPYHTGWLPWPGASLNLLRPTMRQKLAEHALNLQDNALFKNVGVAEGAIIGDLRNNGTSLRHLQILGQSLGIDVHAPFIDKHVMTACLRLPAHRRMIPGAFKPLLTAAFGDVLPPDLFKRVSKSAYAHELYRGLRISLPHIRGLLKDSRLADIGVIEPKNVLEEVMRLDMGIKGSFSAICKVIGAELWIRELAGE